MTGYRGKLNEIILSLTNQCNLRCVMCQIPQQGGGDELTTDEVKGMVRDALKLKARVIVFSGGEPLLRKDIFELISFVRAHNLKSCLTSNGTLIDGEAARNLSSAGVNVVNISIEGPEDVHDALRGKGNFKKALSAINNLARYKIEATMATLVCRQNYAFLSYCMELAHRMGVTTVKFQPFNEIFLVDKERQKDFFIPAADIESFRANIEHTIDLSKEYRIATNPADYLRRLPYYLCGQPGSYSAPGGGCASLVTSCPISAKGEVLLCWVLADKVLGNIKTTGLSEIWNSKAHKRLKDETLKRGCRGCLMSCYDNNFQKFNLRRSLIFRGRRLLGVFKHA